jgi:ribosomal protein L31E
MATKENKSTDTLERTYVVNLRRGFIKVPPYKKTSKAIRELREFIIHHMKCPDVKIGKYLNLEIWKHGKKNPPAKVEVKCLRKDGVVLVELINRQFVEAPKETKKDKKAAAKKSAPEVKKEAEAKLKEEVLEHPDKKSKTHDVEAKPHKKDIMNIVDNKTSTIPNVKK